MGSRHRFVKVVEDSGRTDATNTAGDVDLRELMLASRAVAAVIVRSLGAVDPGISPTQMRVLVILWSGDHLNLTAIAASLGVNSSNASRTCERLVSAGLVARGEFAEDRRQRMFTLTTRGRNLVDALLARREAELAEIVARMSEGDRVQLMRALAPFNRAAHADLWPSLPFAGRSAHLLEWEPGEPGGVPPP
jgi:DNA-binding MarR family transcriptional regulator